MPKRDLKVVIQYFSKLSLQIRISINPAMKSEFTTTIFGLLLPSKCKLNDLFAFKAKILASFHDIVSKFQCGDCYDTYHDKTKLYFNLLSTKPTKWSNTLSNLSAVTHELFEYVWPFCEVRIIICKCVETIYALAGKSLYRPF